MFYGLLHGSDFLFGVQLDFIPMLLHLHSVLVFVCAIEHVCGLRDCCARLCSSVIFNVT